MPESFPILVDSNVSIESTTAEQFLATASGTVLYALLVNIVSVPPPPPPSPSTTPPTSSPACPAHARNIARLLEQPLIQVFCESFPAGLPVVIPPFAGAFFLFAFTLGCSGLSFAVPLPAEALSDPKAHALHRYYCRFFLIYCPLTLTRLLNPALDISLATHGLAPLNLVILLVMLMLLALREEPLAFDLLGAKFYEPLLPRVRLGDTVRHAQTHPRALAEIERGRPTAALALADSDLSGICH
ncbi:hypothetical protein B0H19DRAFT_1255486 [Mycena capillaripes]|nr:hypothetical protein B0H19DRAFT_1255486 [Mycena capillaripes]